MKLSVHEISRQSFVNGPGLRAVVWVQGCSIGCPGCFNPQTHSRESNGIEWNPDQLGSELGRLPVDGLTISGGEPLQQPEAVQALIRAFRHHHDGTVLLFTGFSADVVLRIDRFRQVAMEADAVLAGPYVPDTYEAAIWHNKRLLLVTNRISPDELIPEKRLEIGIDGAGIIRMSGYPSIRDRSNVLLLVGKENRIDDQR